MKFEIDLDMLPAGYAASDAKPGDDTAVIVRGSATTEDGDILIKYLEGVSESYLSKTPLRFGGESSIDHLIAIVSKNKKATVIVNEAKIFALMQVKRNVKAGEAITSDDVADVSKLKIEGLNIPHDCGVSIILSSGWRKAYYFDYGPLMPSPILRSYDLEAQLGQLWCYLLLQKRLNISETQWKNLTDAGWFPFIDLTGQLLDQLLLYAKNSWTIDDHIIDQIESFLQDRSLQTLEKINTLWLFEGHRQILSRAMEHFRNKDYISCTAILYPRIEGVIRGVHLTVAPSVKATQKTLSETAVADILKIRNSNSVLLPDKFSRYIRDVYFSDFDPHSVSGASRNSIAHGVSPENQMGKKASILGWLILGQIGYFLNKNSE